MKDSKRTGAVIFDEKHEYLDSTNMNTLMSGLGKVKDPRKITITTDGHVRGGVLDKEKEENKKILELICRNEEKLKATMTDEQKELFEKYADCVREHQTNTDCLIFQNGFKLGARMMLEVMEE